jgi:molybdate transport system regulatory protein
MSRRSHRFTVRHKVWLETVGGFALGDGGIELLQAVDGAGSLRGAAAQLGWSYRHVLRYLANAEAGLGTELVARVRGGHERGGARLTPAGRDLLRRYTGFRRRLDRALDRLSRVAFPARAR